MPILVPKTTQDVIATATARKLPLRRSRRSCPPYTARPARTPPAQNFGLTVGEEYDIQWPQYNGGGQL